MKNYYISYTVRYYIEQYYNDVVGGMKTPVQDTCGIVGTFEKMDFELAYSACEKHFLSLGKELYPETSYNIVPLGWSLIEE